MKSTDNFAHLRVASPCPASWDQMTGDHRVRFCDLCNLPVYNIARMTRREASALIAKSEGRVCAQLYRRTDGTIITKDCPVGLRALRRRAAKAAGVVFAMIMSLAGSVAGQKPSSKDKSSCHQQVKITRKTFAGASDNSVLTATILDPNGAVVAGAKIALTNQATRKTDEAESNNEGRLLVNIPGGTYDIAIKSPGFSKLTVTDVKVGAKEIVTAEIFLLPDEGTVTVGILLAGPPLIDTSSSSTTIIISAETLRKLPIP